MLPDREMLLCRYHYDPLDRLVDCTPSAQTTTRRFYLKDRLATEIQGAMQRSIMQYEDQLLSQRQRQSGVVDTRLLATDQQRSVLNVLDAARPCPLTYSPYGHRPAENGLLSLLGFNGERPDPVTGCYLLGNGYRAFNPVLMRYNSPDSWSPFGDGGLNAYGYCAGVPVNRRDDTGHAWNVLKWLTPSRTFSTSRSSTLRVSPSKTSLTIEEVASPPKSKLSKLENIIDRNQQKLQTAETRLDDYRMNQPNVFFETLEKNHATTTEFGKEFHETILREAIEKKLASLETKVTHYKNKILKLDNRAMEIRTKSHSEFMH